MADVQGLIRSPKFQALPFEDRKQLLMEASDSFKSAPASAQVQIMNEMKQQDWWQGGVNKRKAVQPEMKSEAAPWKHNVMKVVRPALEGLGMVGGGLIGSGAAPVAGTIAGAGLGYAAGSTLSDIIGQQLGTQSKPNLQQALTKGAKDVGTGALYEMGGQVVPKTLSMAVKGIGSVVKPALGKMSGVGPGAIEEAVLSGTQTGMSANPLKSQTGFDAAMRGKVSGEEIVNNAKEALNLIKDKRAAKYQADLAVVAQNTGPVNMTPIHTKLNDLMSSYRVNIVNGKVDTSSMKMGKSGRNDVVDIIEEVNAWKDNTPMGLDALKGRLDDFYSDSSQARQFVASLRNAVRDTIVKAVPKYDEMTKGYSEATKLIKDVESDLMLRKQGMSGRVTADKTLRRLMSSMRDNFEMRKELVEILGDQGGKDLAGEIAGYTMNTAMPRGLAGTGPALAGAGYLTYLNPKLWPVLAASSPRVQGEFLRMWGKGLVEAGKITPAMRASLLKGGLILSEKTNNQDTSQQE